MTVTPTGCTTGATTISYPASQTSLSYSFTCGQSTETVTFNLTIPATAPKATAVTASGGVVTLESLLSNTIAGSLTWKTPPTAGTGAYIGDFNLAVSKVGGPDPCGATDHKFNVPPGTSTTFNASVPCRQDRLQRIVGDGSNPTGYAIRYFGNFFTGLAGRLDFTIDPVYVFSPPGADIALSFTGPTETSDLSVPIVLTVTNKGPSSASRVEVVAEDAGAVGTSLFYLSDTRAGCEEVLPGMTQCVFEPLAPGESVRVSFTGRRLAKGGQLLKLFALTLLRDDDPVSSNDDARLQTYFRDCLSVSDCVFQLLCEGSPGQVASRVLDAVTSLAAASADFLSLYRLRDEVFARSAAGRRYTELYYAHTAEVARLVTTNSAFRTRFVDAYSLWKDHIAKLVDGQGSSAVITQAQIDGLTGVIEQIKTLGSPELRAVLAREQALLNLPSLVGKTMDQANAQQQATAPATVTIPAAASIHGIAPAFFHSDLRVLNPSTSSAVTVTARYRCFTGPCPSSLEKTFTVAPRELKVYDDVINTLFSAPETAGAIELVGAVLAESRVYTPVKPAPTTGSDVPGLPADEAYAESVLTSLSRDGFRTNVGVYNPGPDPLTVSIDVHRPDGLLLGTATRSIGATAAIQVNDVFGAAGVTGEVADAYAIVKADGVHQLFAYATVIDGQSQDSVFVKGRNARGGEPFVTTIPAAASIHGVPPAFFHSDVRLYNPASATAEVVARYRCFTGTCPTPSPKTISIEPGAMAVLDDIVANLFQAPESAGAIEVSGNALVDSRVYTPTRPAPTTGTGIPGQAEVQSTTEAALLSLSHSADTTRGFRTNLGVYNPGPLDLSVGISLRRPDGTEIAKLTRTVPGFSAVQVNNVFATAGVAADVPAAWGLVSGDGFLPFFAYATVIDNQSQDSVYVKGRALRAP